MLLKFYSGERAKVHGFRLLHWGEKIVQEDKKIGEYSRGNS
jgi:hypothetical protein